MSLILETAFANALMATILAVVVFAVTRVFRQPALAHALWILVLLKLATPSFIEIPSDWFELRPNVESIVIASESTEVSGPVVVFSATRDADVAAISHPAESNALMGICLIWGGGAVFWLAVQFIQAIWFQRSLRNADEAPPEISEQARRIALCMGVVRPPKVLLVDRRVSPMLWAFGRRACVILPGELLDRLSPTQLETLVAHEVGHFARGDHWVRLLEVLVVGLFWWHPVAWWARHEVQEAEEECCDAKVVAHLPNCSRTYAEAILATLQFLSKRSVRCPATASGAVRSRSLRRRILLILRGDVPEAMPEKLKVLVVAASCVVLAFGRPGRSSDDALPARTPTFQERVTHLPAQWDDDQRPSGGDQASPAVRLYSEVPMLAHSFANGRKRVVLLYEDGAYLKDFHSGTSTRLTQSPPSSAQFSADGGLVLLAGKRQLQLIDAGTLEVRALIQTGNKSIASTALDSEGSRIAVGGDDGSVSVWSSRSRGLIHQAKICSQPILGLRFCDNQDGVVLLAQDGGSTRPALIVWDLAAQRMGAYRRCRSLDEGRRLLQQYQADEILELSHRSNGSLELP